ncbi:MAG: hypothetical protein H7Y17_09460, partial [Chlorobia bacterium]|nr:hypothetical protein [Fimbriimonadaceae bacterium]
MQTDFTNEAQLRAARQLALHLRQKPEDAQRPSDELAEQFGLPAAFVSNVLSGVQGSVRRSDPWLPRIDLSFIVRAYRRVDGWFERLIRNPVLFVLLSSALVIVASFFAGPDAQLSFVSNNLKVNAEGLLMVLAFLLVFGLHIVTFFKKKMVRYALLSSLGLWIGLSILTMTAVWLGGKDNRELQPILSGVLLLISFLMLLVCSIYAAIGGGA